MILKEITINLHDASITGDQNVTIKSITADSREVQAGSMFVAVKGGVDGHQFIDQAIQAGAVAIVAQNPPTEEQKKAATWVQVKDSAEALGILASRFYGDPSASMKVVGVTGTNGKTTTTYLLHHIMKTAWTRAGLIGTVKFDDGVHSSVATHTTPDTVTLQKLLRDMRDNSCRGVAMEVSSHGLDQKRVAGVSFNVGVFSNLTQDHLDYHGDMEAYYAAKLGLFEMMIAHDQEVEARGKDRAVAVINGDDVFGQRMIRDIGERLKVWSYGMGVHNDFRFSSIRQTYKGMSFQLDVQKKSYLVKVPLIGKFNVYNVVSAIAASAAVGIKVRDAIKILADAPQVPGRMENVGNVNGMSIFVDYAHTPDALANACATLNELDPVRLITVFGCGGDRDVTKRPIMGAAVSKHSDVAIITSDNPRSEDPESIIKMIMAGTGGKHCQSVVDRAKAIEIAVELSRPGDLILIAGKGHETYQEFADETIDFDDRAVARRILREVRVGDLKQRMDKIKEQDKFSKSKEHDIDRGERRDHNRDRDK